MKGTVVERATPLSRGFWLVATLLILVLAAAPWWLGRGELRLIAEFAYLIVLAQMWNLLAGYGGMISIGQHAYVGIGAYALLILSLHAGVHPFLAVPVAGLVAAVMAAPLSRLVFVLKGPYFAIGTWVVADVLRLVMANVPALGGGSGESLTSVIVGVPAWEREAVIYWMALAAGVGLTMGMYLFLTFRHGLALTAIRDSEAASASLGVEVDRVKLLVYVASAAGLGLVGALIYLIKLRISPDAAFSIEWTVLMIFIVTIGGIGTIEGPIVGTAVYFLLRYLLADFGTWYLVVLGAVAVVVMLKAPKGIWGWVAHRYDLHLFPTRRRMRLGTKAEAAAAPALDTVANGVGE